MHAVIGRVQIEPERAIEALALIAELSTKMRQEIDGSVGYWARSLEVPVVQHSFWLYETEEAARKAEATFSQLRDMPDAPATFISVDVCLIVGQI